jgi:AcrR family transcriptional regulator
MTAAMSGTVPDELIGAALRAADEMDRQVADVPVAEIAMRAGMSRSTLLRRLGGSRAALDDAVRAAGVDPGGQPVRVRALRAAAERISESGLGATTMEAIAARAECSVDSLYAVFGSRDDLFGAVFEQYGPIIDIDEVLAGDHMDLTDTVRRVYRTLAEALSREPRVTPALLAEALARPTSPAVRSVVRHNAPRLLAVLGRWLDGEVRAGRIRDLPVPLLLHQFTAPVVVHVLLRPAAEAASVMDLPDIDRACDIFADAFIRAVAVQDQRQGEQR